MAIKDKGWYCEYLGKGYVSSGRGMHDKGFTISYKVSFQPFGEQIQEMTRFVEDIIRDRQLPSKCILIETSKVSLTSETQFMVRANEVYDQDMASRLLFEISSIGDKIEKRYFPSRARLRTA